MAGTTSSHNRAGQYTRNRRAPVQPIGTGRRAFIRTAFGSSSSQWAALTFSQQAAWSAYADSHPILDSLGQSIKLTGQQMFVSINTQLINAGQPISPTPPVSSDVFSVSGSTVQVDSSGLVVVMAAGLGTSADFLLVAFSAPKSGGVTFNKTFWQAGVQAGDLADPDDYAGQYVGEFGLPPTGGRVFFKLTPVNQYGVTGVPLIGFATVTDVSNAAVATAGLTGVINWTFSGTNPANWVVEVSHDGGVTWAFVNEELGTARTHTGLPPGSKARVYGIDATGKIVNAASNAVTIV